MIEYKEKVTVISCDLCERKLCIDPNEHPEEGMMEYGWARVEDTGLLMVACPDCQMRGKNNVQE